jgi:hypothetical protein
VKAPLVPSNALHRTPWPRVAQRGFPRSLRSLGAVGASAGHHIEVSWLKSRSVFSFKAEYQTRSTSLREDRNP